MGVKLGTAVTTVVALLLGMVLTADAASIRVKCEKRANRSKISVDGFDLSPANGQFTARVTSPAAGGQTQTATKNAVLGEAEFDFDSDAGDIAAPPAGEGATPIGVNFITITAGPNNDVKGEIFSGATATGTAVVSSSVDCRQK